MKRQIVLVAFADSSYNASMTKLDNDTVQFPFTKRYFLSEKDLPKGFIKQLHLYKYRRGYGYWRWKSFLVKKIMLELNYNDILIWSDVGNEWNMNGLKRFYEYINMAIEEESGIVCFQQPFLEKDYTKGDLLDFLDIYNDNRLTMSFQLWAGAFIIRKTNTSMEFINKWEEINSNNINLVTDKRSTKPNLSGFVEHRHDQSVFSCLLKKYPHTEISYEEVYCIYGNNSFSQTNSFPILGKRNIIRSKYDKIKLKFLFPYRYVIGLYLKYIEKMYFIHKFWW